jgi:hypothetical protein
MLSHLMFPWLNLSIAHRELIQNLPDSVGVAETINVRSESVHAAAPERALGELFRREGHFGQWRVPTIPLDRSGASAGAWVF